MTAIISLLGAWYIEPGWVVWSDKVTQKKWRETESSTAIVIYSWLGISRPNRAGGLFRLVESTARHYIIPFSCSPSLYLSLCCSAAAEDLHSATQKCCQLFNKMGETVTTVASGVKRILEPFLTREEAEAFTGRLDGARRADINLHGDGDGRGPFFITRERELPVEELPTSSARHVSR